MKIVGVTGTNDYYFIETDSGIGIYQRKGPKTASETPLTQEEEIICAFCELVSSIKEQL